MKKKGRICGTIGLILSLALAGGTVVYGTMFHGNTVGKAEKLVGSSTGTVFDGWFKHTGFDETKALVDQTVGQKGDILRIRCPSIIPVCFPSK